MRVEVITDVLIYEGIVASIVSPLLIYYLKSRDKMSAYFTTGLVWFVVWVLRQFTRNLVEAYKRHYGIPVRTFHVNISL